jgi:hypothetical protein
VVGVVTRPLAIVALLSLSGCQVFGAAAGGCALLGIGAQVIGIAAQGETLVQNTWLDFHPKKPPPLACPVPQ